MRLNIAKPFRAGGLATVIVGAVVFGAGTSALGSGGDVAPDRASSHHGACPAKALGALRLPADGVPKAAQAVLRTLGAVYKADNVEDAQVTLAELGSSSGEVAYLCPEKVQERSVVVQLRFPKMEPSASLAEGIVVVSRFRDGYRVWYRIH